MWLEMEMGDRREIWGDQGRCVLVLWKIQSMPAPWLSKNEMGVKKGREEQVTSIKMENGPGLEEVSEREMKQFMIWVI